MIEISIIIPVLNEETVIVKTLNNLQKDEAIEVIIVDGGSQDNTVQLVRNMGVKIIKSTQANRSLQMNQGALLATGNILLFLHADTILPQGYDQLILNSFLNSKIVGGAFRLKIDLSLFSLRLIEILVNWRSQFCSIPYGDQGIFVKTSVFREIGGFTNFPIMEDFEFIQRLKKRGKIIILSAKVVTSGRRWQKLGVIKTTLINQLIILGYYLGIPPKKLAQWYRGK
ncbi:MAG: TIGR04283 family arsenosugar biosynthesis glycosyltransferase [cyanobacterium endosymbiont of Rhopalodia musculus]|uniref:TIGR04283 family arsenosugar biosynthesis glycosyltransferase n=1 Tax=cyanobacterium endosymbiont of Epithemia clementina EcSB TaxID=3034674 RepID=UPI002480D61C|nr:TIGR04283 family arsenosugar biosynthesis glycosyltransferase [cyanobacterium endosymbiont of Epithemia clementina EcSB]WGT67242.1 TIGR04283 family arsenosugar biosynthesis glycosyltransferase [cyanobacterium endosymbiont of Epithemia clementina EcSB]